jgi:hypothetical protein
MTNRSRWMVLGLVATLLGMGAGPAEAVVVQTKQGERIDAERVYPTVTALVIVARNFDLRVLPNGEVATIDGEAYTGPASVPSASPDPLLPTPLPASTPAASSSAPPAAPAAFYPLRPGTSRTYRLTVARQTWRRDGREMKPAGKEAATGVVQEVVDGADPMGPTALTETSTERTDGRAAHQSSVIHLLDPRADGAYLLGQTITEPNWAPPTQSGRISVPPMVWPASMRDGQTWTVGPYRHLGIYTAGRMQVVRQESVSVPAGTYPTAWRVEGFMHVFGGDRALRAGRLVMEHGTLETTTWFVPGLGPVKEEAKFHAHQTFFDKNVAAPERPGVLEERSTRVLTEYTLGR